MSETSRRRWLLILVAFPLACLAGCGNGKVTLKGTVSFDGTPIEQGKIDFDSADGESPGCSAEITDGQYLLTGERGAVPGKKIVRIWGFRKTGRNIDVKGSAPGLAKEGGSIEEKEMFVPAEFNTKSTTVVEIQPGKENVFDYTLTKRR